MDGTNILAGTAGKGANEMANHLRELMERVAKRNVLVMDNQSQRHVDHALLFFNNAANGAICFDAGDYDGMPFLKIVSDLVRLPYPVCWIEFAKKSSTGDLTIGALISDHQGALQGQVWSKFDGEWRYSFSFESQPDVGQSKIAGYSSEEDTRIPQSIIATVRAFLSALNCTNIRRVEHKPDSKLQKSRAKRGKQPLFSYWTLELDLSRPESSESLGGTHASPRLHLRRGHPRQYAPGKWTWVQPCAVGNKKAGMVHKDYKVVSQ